MSDAKTRMDNLKDWTYEHRRPLMCGFAVLAVIVLIIGLCLSWFVNNKALSTVGKVQGPATLKIKGPNQTAMEQMDLTYDADADTTSQDGTVTRKRAFCVESQGRGFELQIANTTNISGLEIRVYRATDVTKGTEQQKANADVVGRDGLNNYYAWKKKDNGEVEGFTCINKAADGDIAAGKDASNFDSQTFGDYSSVQKNARTLYRYKQIGESELDEPKSETSATRYIIECSWPKATNIKETDVVYIIARSPSSNSK